MGVTPQLLRHDMSLLSLCCRLNSLLGTAHACSAFVRHLGYNNCTLNIFLKIWANPGLFIVYFRSFLSFRSVLGIQTRTAVW